MTLLTVLLQDRRDVLGEGHRPITVVCCAAAAEADRHGHERDSREHAQLSFQRSTITHLRR